MKFSTTLALFDHMKQCMICGSDRNVIIDLYSDAVVNFNILDTNVDNSNLIFSGNFITKQNYGGRQYTFTLDISNNLYDVHKFTAINKFDDVDGDIISELQSIELAFNSCCEMCDCHNTDSYYSHLFINGAPALGVPWKVTTDVFYKSNYKIGVEYQYDKVFIYNNNNNNTNVPILEFALLDYLTKPYEFDDLYALVSRKLKTLILQ